MAFNVVERVKVLYNILKNFLGLVDDSIWIGQKLQFRSSDLCRLSMSFIILSAVVASNNTSLYAEAGDVSGGFLIIRRKAFIVLGSLAVLLSRLTPPGAGSAHKRKNRYLQSILVRIQGQRCKKNSQSTTFLLLAKLRNLRICGLRSKTV